MGSPEHHAQSDSRHSSANELYWSSTISTVEDWDVKLNEPDAEIRVDELSLADIETLDAIYAQFGHWNRWRLIDEVMHKLPEWRDPATA